MNSHQIIFIQFSNNEGSKSQQFLGGGWRHLNDRVWKRSPGHDTNDVIMGGFDAHGSTLKPQYNEPGYSEFRDKVN